MWLPSGGPQLRVLSVFGAVRQHRASDPAGKAADYARGKQGTTRSGGGGSGNGGREGGQTPRQKQGRRKTRRRRLRQQQKQGNARRGENGTRREAIEATGYVGVIEEEGRCRRDGGNSGGGGGKRRRARVRLDPGGLTSLGGLRGLGSREPRHASGRRCRGGRDVAGVVA